MSSPPGSRRGGRSIWIGDGAGSPRDLGPGEFRGDRRGPYMASRLAPLEFGLRVTTGRANQPDFIPFCPAAFGLGQSLLWP